MKLTKTEIKKYLSFLNKYKEYVGFSDWKVTLNDEYKDSSDIAEVFVDYLEKELEVHLYKLFKDLPEEKQINTLFHELVHARVFYFTKLTKRACEFFEEDMVNDLVRGFEKHKKLIYDEPNKTNAKTRNK